jgi:pilus assembly protein cpaF
MVIENINIMTEFEKMREELANALSDYRNISDDDLIEIIDKKIEEYEKLGYMPLRKKIELRTSLFDSFRRLDILQELIDNEDITEIMINGKDSIFVEKLGKIQKWDKSFKSDEQLEDMIQKIVSSVNRIVNVATPIADARLEDGSRVHVVLPPISLTGPIVTIRKFPEAISMDKLLGYNSLSKEAAIFLKKLVKAGYNIFISGGTNSGKTTFLNALSAYIPEDERVITIEDSAELQLMQIKNLVRLESRNPNSEGEGRVSIADLIKAALRMNPDRIVIGEVRSSEALDMLQAINTGHDGSLSTGHGNSPKDMLSRIETMALSGADLPLPAIRAQIAGALDIIVHLGRLRDRSRRVLSIMEVGEYKNGEVELFPLFEFKEYGEKKEVVLGKLEKIGTLKNIQKILASGDRL